MKLSSALKHRKLSHVAQTASMRVMSLRLLLAGWFTLGIAVTSLAASLAPGGVVAPVPGATNPPNAFLGGTVLADMTVPYANGGIAPANPVAGQQPVTIAFRGTNARAPFYLIQRYLSAGATIGPIDGLPAPGFTGTLRTVVVRETVGGTLDFYLQVHNTSQGATPGEPNDIFRISAGGFNDSGFAGDALDVFYRTDGSAADVIPGATVALMGDPGEAPPRTADRLADNNTDVGFDFDLTPGGGSSIFGDVSRFLLIRTSATAFGPSIVTISSTGTAYVSSLAPITVPEPVAVVLLALAGAALVVARYRQEAI